MSIYSATGDILSAAYGADGSTLAAAYDDHGNLIYTSGDEPPVPTGEPDYYNFIVSPSVPHVGGQGFDIYNGMLFMVAGNGLFHVVDAETGEDLLVTSITVGHGNSVSFSNEFLNQGDEFPLLYISKDQGDPCDVYVYHVERGNDPAFVITLVRTLRWQLSEVGYYANAAYDYEHRVMYMLSYTQDSYQATENNVMQISKWDMTRLTENQDGTFTPAYISRVITDYVIAMRAGQTFHDGMIWTGSGSNSLNQIYGINPATGAKMVTLPMNLNSEYEGEAFIDDFHMVAGYNAGSNNGYYLYTFQPKAN